MDVDLEAVYSKYNPLCNQNITSVVVFGSTVPTDPSLQPSANSNPSLPHVNSNPLTFEPLIVPPLENTTSQDIPQSIPSVPSTQQSEKDNIPTDTLVPPTDTLPMPTDMLPPPSSDTKVVHEPDPPSEPTQVVSTTPPEDKHEVEDIFKDKSEPDDHEPSDDDLSFRLFGSKEPSDILRTLQEKIGSVKASIMERIEKVHQTQTLSQNITQLLLQKQYDTASYRLPVVMKEIQTTPGVKPPRGLYYINRNGRKIYLNESQRRKWKQGDEIPGCIKGCSAQG